MYLSTKQDKDRLLSALICQCTQEACHIHIQMIPFLLQYSAYDNKWQSSVEPSFAYPRFQNFDQTATK